MQFASFGEPLDIEIVQIALDELLLAPTRSKLTSATLPVLHPLLQIAQVIPLDMLDMVGVQISADVLCYLLIIDGLVNM